MNIVLFTGSAWVDPNKFADVDATIYPVLRPIGAYQVASVLRNASYTVKVIDYFPYLIAYKYDELILLIEKYVTTDTLWIGFSTTFFDGYDESDLHPLRNEKIAHLKSKILSIKNDIKIVIGGAKSWKKGHDDFANFYVEGYADSSVVELTKYIEGKNPFFQIKNKSVVSDRAATNFDFSEYDFQWDESDAIQLTELLPIEISRGCIFKCAYCSYPLNGKKKLDFIKKPNVLLDELTRNYELFGVNSYMYTDDTHNDSLDKLRYLYDEVYSKLPFKIRFSAYLRLDLLRAHEEMIPLLKESGLKSCFFGIESLNNESNKAVGKGMSTEKIVNTLNTLRAVWNDVFMQAGFIIGLPNESEETATEWLNIILPKTFPLDRITINPLHLFKDQGESGYWFNDIENNPAKYGYTFIGNNDWINNKGLTKRKSTAIINAARGRFRGAGRDSVTWLTDWRLRTLGLSREQYNMMDTESRINRVDIYIGKYINTILKQ